jgi:hypothetical protein
MNVYTGKTNDLKEFDEAREKNNSLFYLLIKNFLKRLQFQILCKQTLLMIKTLRYSKIYMYILKMEHRKRDDCYLSPVLDLECGGDGGTGSQTTQTYDAPTVKKIKV